MPDSAESVTKSPSPRLWHMRRTEVAGAAGLAAVLGGVVAGVTVGAPAGAAAAVAVAACGAIALWFVRNRFRAWTYQERDDDLLVSRGVLIRRLSVVPFVDVTAGPVERVYRLATVKLHTAAAASDARIPGLERDEAARLRDRLAALGEAKAAGL